MIGLAYPYTKVSIYQNMKLNEKKRTFGYGRLGIFTYQREFSCRLSCLDLFLSVVRYPYILYIPSCLLLTILLTTTSYLRALGFKASLKVPGLEREGDDGYYWTYPNQSL